MNRLVRDMMSVATDGGRGRLLERLASLGISATVVLYPAHETVDNYVNYSPVHSIETCGFVGITGRLSALSG